MNKSKKTVKIILGTLAIVAIIGGSLGVGYMMGNGKTSDDKPNELVVTNGGNDESLGTYFSADRGAATGQVVDNTTPIPSDDGTDTKKEYTGFEPENIAFNEDGTVDVNYELLEALRDLPEFKDYTLDELNQYIVNLAPYLSKGTTSKEIYDIINKYNAKDLIDYLSGHYLKDIPPTSTPMPTQIPKQEDLTFTYFENIYDNTRYALTDIHVWSEATDFGRRVDTIKAVDDTVVIVGQCNETGYYHVKFISKTSLRNGEDVDFSEGYIHPHHYQYLTNAEMEYEKQQAAQQNNPTPAPTAKPTPAPTAKPTEKPSDNTGNTSEATPTEKPTSTPKPTEKPTSSAKDYSSYKIKYSTFEKYITGYTDEGYPILPDGNIITPDTTITSLGYNPKYIDGYSENGIVIIDGVESPPVGGSYGDSADGGGLAPIVDPGNSGIH